VLEAAEEAGIARAILIGPLGMKEAELVDAEAKVEWRTLVLLMEQLSRVVDGDIERLRDVGARMIRTPSYRPFRRFAEAVVSVRRLYDIANRFVAPTNFPHLTLIGQFASDERMHLHAEIPSSHVSCATFFHLFEGSVTQLPALLGLPPAVLIESRVTPRTCDMVVALPRSRSLVART